MKKITLIVEDENGKKVTATLKSDDIVAVKKNFNRSALDTMYNVLLNELKNEN
jgi:hypothetical protein